MAESVNNGEIDAATKIHVGADQKQNITDQIVALE